MKTQGEIEVAIGGRGTRRRRIRSGRAGPGGKSLKSIKLRGGRFETLRHSGFGGRTPERPASGRIHHGNANGAGCERAARYCQGLPEFAAGWRRLPGGEEIVAGHGRGKVGRWGRGNVADGEGSCGWRMASGESGESRQPSAISLQASAFSHQPSGISGTWGGADEWRTGSGRLPPTSDTGGPRRRRRARFTGSPPPEGMGYPRRATWGSDRSIGASPPRMIATPHRELARRLCAPAAGRCT